MSKLGDGDVNEDGNYNDWLTLCPNHDCANDDILDPWTVTIMLI